MYCFALYCIYNTYCIYNVYIALGKGAWKAGQLLKEADFMCYSLRGIVDTERGIRSRQDERWLRYLGKSTA